MKRTTQAGFTLIELMIALLMTALVMTLVFGGLRILSRGWEGAEARQQQISEQYQVQQLLRRLIGQARNERVRDVDSVLQSAFRGEPDQMIFVAPRHQNSGDASLLWYRLRLATTQLEDEEEEYQALMLDTRAFRSNEIVDWTLLFEEPPETGPEETVAPVFDSHRLLITGPARLELQYLEALQGELDELRDDWHGLNALPRRVDLFLEPEPNLARADADEAKTVQLLSAWQELKFGLKEYSYDVRSF